MKQWPSRIFGTRPKGRMESDNKITLPPRELRLQMVTIGTVLERTQNAMSTSSRRIVSWLRIQAPLWCASILFVLGSAGLQSAMCQARGDLEPHLAEGMSRLRSGDFRGALSELQLASRLNPTSADATILLGITQSQLGQYRLAVSSFKAALNLDSHSEAAHYNLALALLHLQKHRDALQELEETVRLNPANEPAQYNLGVLFFNEGRMNECIHNFEAARSLNPDNLATLSYLVNAYLHVGNGAAALPLARDAIQRDSEGTIAGTLGAFLLNAGYYNEAIDALDKSRTHFPENIDFTTNLARAYVANGQRELAKRLLLEAIRSQPSVADLHYELGALLLMDSDAVVQNSGFEEIQEAIRRLPGQPRYYLELGKWMLENHRQRQAIELLQRGLDSLPSSVDLYVMLALAELQLNGARASTPYLDKALQLNPRSGPAVHLLGCTYFKTGDYTSAARYFKQATELSPHNGLYFFNLAEALERMNKPADALPFAETSVHLEPNHGYFHYVLGKLYSQVGRKDDAIKQFEKCLELDASIDDAYYLLARTYMRSGDLEKAHEWDDKFRRLKEINSRSSQLVGPSSASMGVDLGSVP